MSKSYWNGVKRTRKICRDQRRRSAEKHLSRIQELCAKHGIVQKTVAHGYQFVLREYVINWSPSTNKVQVQYRLSGHDRTVRFTKAGRPNTPRILVALEELVSLVRPVCLQVGPGVPGPQCVVGMPSVPSAQPAVNHDGLVKGIA